MSKNSQNKNINEYEKRELMENENMRLFSINME